MNYKIDKFYLNSEGCFTKEEIDEVFPSLNHVYNYVKQFNTDIKFSECGLYFIGTTSYISKYYFEPTHFTFEDKKGRKWERFLDYSYYDMVCVKKVDDKNFNSPDVYHFNTMADAEIFSSLLAKAD